MKDVMRVQCMHFIAFCCVVYMKMIVHMLVRLI